MTCPRCSTAGTGRFCTECGAPLANATCASCGNPLTPGAKFCHRCGATAGAAGAAGAPGAGGGAVAAAQPVGASKGATLGTTLPWAVAGIAFLALFGMLAGKGFSAHRGSTLDAPQNALPNPALDAGPPPTGGSNTAADAMGAPFAGGASGGAVRAPDISQMSPADLASRLYDRIMSLDERGKSDSVQFFAPMGIQAYEMLQQQQGHPYDADQRYDIGRIAEVAGALPLAKAQADTILQQQPDHLLGLLLAGHIAQKTGNSSSLREYTSRFDKVKAAQLAKKLPEYVKHQREIAAGL